MWVIVFSQHFGAFISKHWMVKDLPREIKVVYGFNSRAEAQSRLEFLQSAESLPEWIKNKRFFQ